MRISDWSSDVCSSDLGMVSRMIEAKPEELRQWLEEAAGISKYKDRRKETESRIKQTRENLERLNELRTEIQQIGRASCRAGVREYVENPVAAGTIEIKTATDKNQRYNSVAISTTKPSIV